MPLHPYLAERLHLLDGIRMDDLASLDPDTLERLRAFNQDLDWALPAGVTTQDQVVPGPHGDIPVRIYRPDAPTDTFVLWVHGGGFSAGTLDWPESHVVSAELAARATCTVVAVDYRLAGPGSTYPVPLDDVAAAWSWATELARTSGPAAATVLGGASAGAALALAVALRTPDTVDALLLAYPFAHFPVPPLAGDVAAEMDELPAMLRFPPESIEGMVRGYVGRIHGIPMDALPGHAPVNDDQPPTYVLLAEYDDLRPSGELLARQHTEAGVAVTVRLERGVLHGHLNRYPDAPGVSESLDWLASVIVATTPRTAPGRH